MLDPAKVWESCPKSSFSAFEKKSENGAQQASILVPFLSPNRAQLRKKGVPKIVLKNVAPPDANNYLFTCQEAPGEAASHAHCTDKKQLFEQHFKHCLRFTRKNVDLA